MLTEGLKLLLNILNKNLILLFIAAKSKKVFSFFKNCICCPNDHHSPDLNNIKFHTSKSTSVILGADFCHPEKHNFSSKLVKQTFLDNYPLLRDF